MTNTVEIQCHYHHDTNEAIKVSLNGDDKNAIWLPKELIEITYDNGEVVVMSVPEWLAYDKGLI